MQVRVNSVPMMSTGPWSAGVVLNNLTGAAYADEPVDRFCLYLHLVGQAYLGREITPGDPVDLVDETGTVVLSCKVGDGSYVTDAVLAQFMH